MQLTEALLCTLGFLLIGCDGERVKAFVYSGIPGVVELMEYPVPQPLLHEVLIKVDVCWVCRTDLHVIDGELEHPALPVIPGHQIVGQVVATGAEVNMRQVGERLVVTWLSRCCGTCSFCLSGRENLCDGAVFTGYTHDGGFAEYVVVDESYTVPIPEMFTSLGAAPLLCAGLIGYRAYRMTGEPKTLGIYGLGSAVINVQPD